MNNVQQSLETRLPNCSGDIQAVGGLYLCKTLFVKFHQYCNVIVCKFSCTKKSRLFCFLLSMHFFFLNIHKHRKITAPILITLSSTTETVVLNTISAPVFSRNRTVVFCTLSVISKWKTKKTCFFCLSHLYKVFSFMYFQSSVSKLKSTLYIAGIHFCRTRKLLSYRILVSRSTDFY